VAEEILGRRSPSAYPMRTLLLTGWAGEGRSRAGKSWRPHPSQPPPLTGEVFTLGPRSVSNFHLGKAGYRQARVHSAPIMGQVFRR